MMQATVFRFHSLPDSFYSFVARHIHDNVSDLALKYRGKVDVALLDFALTQIECRRKAANKLKPFVESDRFLFADSLSAEQSSDYRISRYHVDIVGKDNLVLDMTAGLGIDAMTLSQKNTVTAIELDGSRAEALKHNADIFELDNFSVINADSIEFLRSSHRKYNVIFIDPARRKNDNRRVYGFRDCEPDILENMDLLKSHADRIVIKASPLLDITQTIRDLDNLESIHVVSVKGECKEVLAVINEKPETKPRIHVVNLGDEGVESLFEIDFEGFLKKNNCNIAEENDIAAGKYLYVPNAGMMKVDAGAFLCGRFEGLKKISPNTSLYVSDRIHRDFPGNIHVIKMIPDKKDIKGLKEERYNVSTRNYPMEAEALRRKLKVKEGKEKFIYGFRAFKKEIPMLIITERL